MLYLSLREKYRCWPAISDKMCASAKHQSRWAQFQYDCQPSEQSAGGCKQENYGACLLAYTA
ncbi:hypothetical protein INR49_002180 [Caranx melampygus]|nr:hypothetical protein INR49_002180 [Caranx melampygus]